MKQEQKKSHLLLQSLTAAALTLPGLHDEAKADAQILKPEADVLYTRYDEGQKGYRIDVMQGKLMIPLADHWDMTIQANKDAQSGATITDYQPASLVGSSWPGTFSDIAEIRSQPSGVEPRSDVSANVRYFGENKNVGVGFYLSQENDYVSHVGNITYQQRFNKNNTELTLGASVSDDDINPAPLSSTIGLQRPLSKSKNTYKGILGLKQDLTDKSFVELGAAYIADQGYLAEPYKQSYVNGNATGFRPLGTTAFMPIIPGMPPGFTATIVQDFRPKLRQSGVFELTFVQYIKPADSSIHFDYNFCINSWHMKSHAITVSYYQPFAEVWQVAPSMRYYTQGEARFYSMLFDVVGNAPFPAKPLPRKFENSSDRRLAKFGTINAEIILSRKFLKDQSLKPYILGGVNFRRNSLHAGGSPKPKNPANHLTTYYASFGVNYRF